MIDPVILGYGFLAVLGVLGFQILFLIWCFYEERKRVVKST